MDTKLRSESIRSVLAKQKMVDLNMSLSQLLNTLASSGEEVGYWAIAFDRYALVVDDVAKTATLDAKATKLALLNNPVFNLNVQLRELTELAFDSKLDQVGFNLAAWDKVVLLTHMPSAEERIFE